MTVQAQYPSNSDVLLSTLLPAPNMFDAINAPPPPSIFSSVPAAVSADHLMLFNPSASRKRTRDDDLMPFPCQLPTQFQHGEAVPNGQSRLLASADASTSGRPHAPQSLVAAQDFRHNTEIDALLRHYNERLRLGLDQLHERHCRALVSVLGKNLMAKLHEKEAELQRAIQRNIELEEKLRQLTAEKDSWFAAAKNSEALASNLKASLEKLLAGNLGAGQQMKPECGECEAPLIHAVEDEESCCFQGEERERRRAEVGDAEEEIGQSRTGEAAVRCRKAWCRVCGEKETSVLLLPCKHLCLCRDCASLNDTCPICGSLKNASLHVVIPYPPMML